MNGSLPAPRPAEGSPRIVPGESGLCANCEAVLAGPYCAQCGQHADFHAHSLRHFVGEAAEVLTHADSRVWRTLWALMVKPGFLVREYFAGRRARYLQPFRLYVIAGVAWLVVGTLFSHRGHDVAAAPAADAAPAAAGATQAAPPAAAPADDAADDEELKALDIDCKPGGTGSGEARNWLQRTANSACVEATRDNGRQFTEAMSHNAGRAMFVFLPMLAAVMTLLYWRPRRYFLEHLVLLLNNHACLYFVLCAHAILTGIWRNGTWGALVAVGLLFYTVRYVYQSMRVAYGQGRALTRLKFVLMLLAYAVCGALMFLLTAAYSALTI